MRGQDLRFGPADGWPTNHRGRGQCRPCRPIAMDQPANTIAAESQAMIEAADKAGLFIQGLARVDAGDARAPRRLRKVFSDRDGGIRPIAFGGPI